MDSRATHYFTLDLAMMHLARPFTGNDHVTVGDGKKLSISHTGHALVFAHPVPLYLGNIYHAPSISKNVISVSKLCHDNQVFVEFHANHFLVKHQTTHQVLLRGHLDQGLYKLQPPSTTLFPSSSSSPKLFLTQTKVI